MEVNDLPLPWSLLTSISPLSSLFPYVFSSLSSPLLSASLFVSFPTCLSLKWSFSFSPSVLYYLFPFLRSSFSVHFNFLCLSFLIFSPLPSFFQSLPPLLSFYLPHPFSLLSFLLCSLFLLYFYLPPLSFSHIDSGWSGAEGEGGWDWDQCETELPHWPGCRCQEPQGALMKYSMGGCCCSPLLTVAPVSKVRWFNTGNECRRLISTANCQAVKCRGSRGCTIELE